MSNDLRRYYSQLNQSLYFARLQTDAAQALMNVEPAQPFNKQQVQSHNESALLHLYRALFFLSCYLTQDLEQGAELQKNPHQLLTIIKQAQLNCSGLLLQLENALRTGGALSTLLSNYLALWLPSTNTIANDDLLITDKALTIEQCRNWHKQLETFASRAAEENTEF